MKRTISKFLCISFIFFIFVLFFGNISSHGIEVETSETHSMDRSKEITTLKYNSIYDPSADENKNIDIRVEDIGFSPFVNGKVFPNKPVDLRVNTTGPEPKILEIWLDASNDDSKITWDIGSNKMEWSSYVDGIVEIDSSKATMGFNRSTSSWNADIPLTFKWDHPKDLPRDLFCIVKDNYGALDSLTSDQAYLFVSDLVVSGEPRVRIDDPRTMTDDGYLKGGINLKMDQVSVHFKGAPEVSPVPSDIEVGIIDSIGKYWQYLPHSSSELSNVIFAIPVPRYDEKVDFSFRVLNSPGNSIATGSADFSFNVDSTKPALGDFRYSLEGNVATLDWALVEEGSGIALDKVFYNIMWKNYQSSGWNQILDPVYNDDRLTFDITFDPMKLSDGDLDIAIKVADRVSNSYSSDFDHHISIDPTPEHDLAVSSEVIISPEQVIVNQRIHFHTMVSNKGTSDENDIPVEIMKDGQLIERIFINGLPAGSSREIRWIWTATEGISNFMVTVDPYENLEDRYPENNRVGFEVVSEYLDVLIKDDYIFFSNDNPEDMELITISFGVRSIGSIESGPINIIFKQDDRFMGTYHMDSISQEGSRELQVDWKVDPNADYLVLEVDPYNEILESIEDNNLLMIPNPFHRVTTTDTDDEEIDPVVVDEEEGEEDADNRVIVDDHEGGTIWSGTVIDEVDGNDPPSTEGSGGKVPYPIPSSDSGEGDGIDPVLLPTIGIIIGTASIGMVITTLRNEVIRWKFLGLLIPLYSKIKKNKLDKGVRGEILGYLKAKPGANYSELKKNLDLNDGSLVHHLRVLEKGEKIYSKKMGKYKLFYVTAYRRDSSIADYISPLQMRILDLINKNPGIVPKKLSKILDRSQTDMSYHLSELSRNGLLEKKKKGRNIHYYLNDEFAEVFA